MSSANKTKNGLNRWIGSDVPELSDFNNDNDILDNVISGLNVERGTFTPTIGGETTNGSVTYSSQLGEFLKYGPIYFVNAYLLTSSISSLPTGNVTINGLPGNTKILTRNLATVNYYYTAGFNESSNAKLVIKENANGIYVGADGGNITVSGTIIRIIFSAIYCAN